MCSDASAGFAAHADCCAQSSGVGNRELAWHYIKWALLISAAGSLVGVAAGAWLGSGLIGLYNEFFRFPSLDYRLSGGTAILAALGSLAAGALGAQSAVRRAIRIPPAEAMRPEPPARYRRSVVESIWLQRHLTHATRMVLRNIERQPARAPPRWWAWRSRSPCCSSGFSFLDVMDVLIDQQFVQTMSQDVTVTFVEPRCAQAVHDVRHLPGVMHIEPMRSVPVRLRVGHRSRMLAITGLVATPELSRVVDRTRGPLSLPPDGLVLSKLLADILGSHSWRLRPCRALEGRRPQADLIVSGLVDDSVGLQAHMQIDAAAAVHAGGANRVGRRDHGGPSGLNTLYAELKLVPLVAGVALRELTLENFRSTLAENMNLSVFFNVLFAGIIAFGVIYNAARVSLSERARELASLRVLGFTRVEISLILLGELALLTVMALPIGAVIGYGLGYLIINAFNNEVYRMPFLVTAGTVAWTFLAIITAALISGLLVRRRLDRLDLIAVLKTRE